MKKTRRPVKSSINGELKNMQLGKRAKKNRITKYISDFFANDEIIEDGLEADDPFVKIQTKDRNVTLTVSSEGKVIEDFRMRKGAGSKADYLKKQETFQYLSAYVAKHYKNERITKESFDDGFIKVQTDTKNLTLTYDAKTNEVIVKERMRKGAKNNNVASDTQSTAMPLKKSKMTSNTIVKPEIISNTLPLKQEPQKKNTSANKEDETSNVSIPKISCKKQKVVFKENDKVKNIFSNETYQVVCDCGGMVEVYKDSVSYQMATSDLMLIPKKKKDV